MAADEVNGLGAFVTKCDEHPELRLRPKAHSSAESNTMTRTFQASTAHQPTATRMP